MICIAWAPFADSEQLAMLAAVALVVVLYSGFRVAVAFGVAPWRTIPAGTFRVKRVRQQNRLLSRSWLELSSEGRTSWLPVYFDPALVGLTESDGTCDATVVVNGRRLFPSGAARDSEPQGRLIDNPTRPDPDGPSHAAASTRLGRRLLLDAQFAVVAPFAGLFWIYVAGGGVPAFAGATVVAAATATWFAAIRGSDPS
ncbi:hypothetical protein A9X06_30435 [Mycobacterium sp. 852002-51759_SCH5129042]|uniref:hypothetical protein n=1 Tax=Nocardia nova TaxID=37330 RepID=UPI0007EAE042|nr:hypothetical protein [Nocardia nova]MBF6276100.1 hypothetical protein [Nocardia nova]OBF70923.1 hypothetical protein A9X06_30435 [Mycobacterium sp. 852002-51759_SCH5129042]